MEDEPRMVQFTRVAPVDAGIARRDRGPSRPFTVRDAWLWLAACGLVALVVHVVATHTCWGSDAWICR